MWSQQYTADEERGRAGSIHHVNDIRWMRGGHRGGGAQLPKKKNALDHPFKCSIAVLEAQSKLLILMVGSSISSTYIFECQPLPPLSMSTHVMNAPKPSPFFCWSSTPMYYCECTNRR